MNACRSITSAGMAVALATVMAGLAACTSGASAHPAAQATPSSAQPATTAVIPSFPPISQTPLVTTPPHDPQTYEGAQAAVRKIESYTAHHNWAADWEMLTKTGKEAMTKADYVYVFSHCAAFVTKEQFLSVSLNDAKTVASVDTQAGDGTEYTWNLVYEDGFWKHQPSSDAMKWMTLSRTKALRYLDC